jgi:metal-dependent hydrolase (beta-lactamase superfamily II)
MRLRIIYDDNPACASLEVGWGFSCLVGGFHLKGVLDEEIIDICKQLMFLGVKKTGPTHCSGDNGIKIFKENFKENDPGKK